jgi:tRNA G18 (ribose-2'-O)-methylase SpoU
LHFLLIEGPADPRLADYRNIPDAELLQRRGIFVAEGRLVVRRLLTGNRFKARSVMLTQSAYAALADVLRTRPDVPVYVVPPSLMNDITGFNIHRGCLAIGERPAPQPWREIVAGVRTLVLLEHVANADNVGGIFRNAAAFGADAILLDEASTDPLYRKAIRTSMGAALLVPFARADSWPTVLRELREGGFATIAMTPSASAPPIRSSMHAIGDRPVALALGHEGEGLTDEALEACEYQARIPIVSTVDSLNVAAAAAVALYELGQSRAVAFGRARRP